MKYFLLFLLLATAVSASHEYYFYNNENDLRYNVDSALYNPFDGHDVEDVTDFDDYECFSLDDYNHYADLDPYDGFDSLTARTISRNEFNNLRYGDQLRIINENPGDKWDKRDINDEKDMECWTLKDYNKFAGNKRADRWDEIKFHDFDDLEQVNEIGIRRYGFIEPDDLAEFDLHLSRPRYGYYDNYYNPYYFYR